MILPSIQNGEDKSFSLANCIRNHYSHLRKWAKRTVTDCFRIYDREIHHFPIAIDLYGGRFCIHYYSKLGDSETLPKELMDDVAKALQIVFGANSESIYWRIRAKHKETRQYEKKGESQEFFVVYEYGCQFRVNLKDYLDTGLFLDHRETRKRVAMFAKGKSVLNLFSYTCAFSVQAALYGASSTKSIDLSNTYTKWGKENFKLNSLSLLKNQVIRADCLKFLEDEIKTFNRYDIIVIDPPTISRSKKMSKLFDIQVDYLQLLSKALKLLNPEGLIIFSTNSRKFSFDLSYFEGKATIKEVTEKTIPLDFSNKHIHRCWEIHSLLGP